MASSSLESEHCAQHITALQLANLCRKQQSAPKAEIVASRGRRQNVPHARRRQAGCQVSVPPLSMAAGPTKAVSRFGSAMKSVARRAATPHGGRCHASPGERAATLVMPIHSSGGPFRHFTRRGGPFCQKFVSYHVQFEKKQQLNFVTSLTFFRVFYYHVHPSRRLWI